MKKFNLYFIFLSLVFVVSCTTRSYMEPIDASIVVPQDSKFNLVEVTNNSGYVFRNEGLILENQLEKQINNALSGSNMLGYNDYTIKTQIIKYTSGNAVARWFVPGSGEIRIETSSTIYDRGGNVITTIPITQPIILDGAYTADAWEKGFAKLAQELINVINNQLINREIIE